MTEYKIVKYIYESDDSKTKYSLDDIDGTEEAEFEIDKGFAVSIKLAAIVDGECVAKVVISPNRVTRSIDVENIWVKEGYERSLHKYNLVREVISLDTFKSMCSSFGFRPQKPSIDDYDSKSTNFKAKQSPYNDVLVFNELYEDDELDSYDRVARMKPIKSLCTLCASPYAVAREEQVIKNLVAKRGY